MTADQLRENGQKLFKERNYAAAVHVLSQAVEAFPKDETLWQELVLSASWSGQHASAVEFAKNAVRNHPRSDWLWRQLGSELTALDRLDEAENALNNSRTLNSKAEWLWRYFAALHRKRKNSEKEIEALEILDSLGKANGTDLNQIGIAYHNEKNFGKALEYYRLSAAAERGVAPLFNMGLVFNDPEVSQDADAADAYRRTLVLKADYERGQKELEATKKKLIPLAEKARAEAAGLIEPDEYFQFYASPFETFQIQDIESPDELEVKTIQRAKKILLQEIDLNDGKVSWLDNHPLDKSRALTLEDELHDDVKREYHWAVFHNKPLLRFLTRGDIEQFLFSDDYFPRETLERLEDDPDFLSFLSKPFARQYNFILTRAIERRLLSLVESLFDGRRWVEPEDDDVCFEGAYRRIGELVEAMRSKAEEGRSRKISVAELEKFLRDRAFHPELFNHLPAPFRSMQSAVVAEIRSLAISSYNEHGDSELSRAVLELSKNFKFKNVELNKRLEEDFKAIEKLVAEERKQAAEERKHSFTVLVQHDVTLEISPKGIRYGSVLITPDEAESLRWGIYVRTVNGVESEHSCTIAVGGGAKDVFVQFNKRGIVSGVRSLFRKDGEVVPVCDMSSADQEAIFRKAVDSVCHFLLSPVCMNLIARITSGASVSIGQCVLSQAGVNFDSGLIFRKNHLVPWRDIGTQSGNGQIWIYSRANPKAKTAMAIKDIDNAVVLPIVCELMAKSASQPPPIPSHGN
jgi:tetratricopeptide (TPR) repeat protein